MISKIFNFFSRHYLIFLALLVFLSYGQLLLMQPWQEDNVIFFKVAHIHEQAGYLGKGILGQGVYRHTITPYYFIYQLFGYQTVFYYATMLIAYLLAILSIYALANKLINKQSAMIASFLFGCGYIASEGFLRVYTSTNISTGIASLSLLFLVFWKYYQTKRLAWYLLTVLLYWLTIELSYVRMHYLIVPVLLFNFIFFCLPLSLNKLRDFVLRSVPFIYIFYKLYVDGSDSRTGSTLTLIENLAKGKLENTFSFISTLGNLLIPDKIQGLYISSITRISDNTVLISQSVVLILFAFILLYLRKRFKVPNFLFLTATLSSIIWFFLNQNIYSASSIVSSSPQLMLTGFIGGLTLIFSGLLAIILKQENRKIFLLFLSILLTNIAAYSAYTPLTSYPTNYRYLAHSFFSLVIIVPLIINAFSQHKISVRPLYLGVISYGVILLFLGVTNQHSILENRSQKIALFYQQLQSHVKSFPKDSLIYFDIQDKAQAQSMFAASFSVAEMPNTTAIAWRYGIDRYDIEMFTEYPKLIAKIKGDKVPLEKVFTFALLENRLVDTSDQFRTLLTTGSPLRTIIANLPATSKPITETQNQTTLLSQQDIVIDFPIALNSLLPTQFDVSISANSLNINTIKLPLLLGRTDNPVYTDLKLRQLAINYKQQKEEVLKTADFRSSSEWQDRVVNNIHDNNPETVWQANRVTWNSESTYIAIDLKQAMQLAGLIWSAGHENNAPTKYKVEVSTNNQDWVLATEINNSIEITDRRSQSVVFDVIHNARHLRITIDQTLSGDAPQISEIWPLLADYKDTNINDLEDFTDKPFLYLPDVMSFEQTLRMINNTGQIRFYWQGNKSDKWLTENDSIINIIYDGQTRQYQFTIPSGGTEINKIKFSDVSIPGSLTLHSLAIKTLPVN